MWRKFAGFKIEADSGDQGRGEIRLADDARRQGPDQARSPPAKSRSPAFSAKSNCSSCSAWPTRKLITTKVVVMGPMRAWKWKYDDPGLPWTITGELWKREDGSQMFEVSIKTPVVQAAAATAGFMAFFAEVGAERDHGQQAKTRWALDNAVREGERAVGLKGDKDKDKDKD